MFWTLEEVQVTLCEHHALVATNNAMRIVGETNLFGSMIEAAVVLNAFSSIGGRVPLSFTSSDTGTCADCEFERDAA